MAGHFEWTGPFTSRSYLYHYVAAMPQVDAATHAVATKVKTRAEDNLAAQHHWVRIMSHAQTGDEPASIEMTKGGGKYPVSSYNVSLVGHNPMALEYGHEPSGFYAGTPTKAPAGTYILHRAADLAGKVTGPRMGREMRARLGRTTT